MSSPLKPRPLNRMQLMALRAVAAEAYVVEKGYHMVSTHNGCRRMPHYNVHVMGTMINSQVGSLQSRKLIKWNSAKMKITLTLAGKECLDGLEKA